LGEFGQDGTDGFPPIVAHMGEERGRWQKRLLHPEESDEAAESGFDSERKGA